MSPQAGPDRREPVFYWQAPALATGPRAGLELGRKAKLRTARGAVVGLDPTFAHVFIRLLSHRDVAVRGTHKPRNDWHGIGGTIEDSASRRPRVAEDRYQLSLPSWRSCARSAFGPDCCRGRTRCCRGRWRVRKRQYRAFRPAAGLRNSGFRMFILGLCQ